MQHGEIKVGGDTLMLSAAMLHTVLGQHTVQTLYRFIVSSIPFKECIFSFACTPLHLSGSVLNLHLHLFSVFTISPSIFLQLRIFCLSTFSLSLCPSVFVPSDWPGWGDCLAL